MVKFEKDNMYPEEMSEARTGFSVLLKSKQILEWFMMELVQSQINIFGTVYLDYHYRLGNKRSKGFLISAS